MLFLLPHTVFWDFTLCPSPQTGDQTFLLSSHFSFTQHCITTMYCTRKTIAGNNGFMIYFDKIALTLVSQWRSLADVSHLSVFSVSCVMNVMVLRQIYIHTQKAGVGHVWGMGVGGQAAYRLLLPSCQGENASRVSPVHSKLLTSFCPDYSLPEQREVVWGTECSRALAYRTGPTIHN